jgi:hypothetical protein
MMHIRKLACQLTFVIDVRNYFCNYHPMMQSMKNIRAIEKWLSQTKWAETTLGARASGNPRAVDRIRRGTASMKTLDDVMDYIKRNPVKMDKG